MHMIDLHRWLVTDRVSGRRYVTRFPMSAANARDLDPMAEMVPGTQERIPVQQVILPPSARAFQASRF
jgi:hypothetical protein